MQDLLYSYDSDTKKNDNTENTRDEYYKKQFKVKYYLKVVIGVSLFVSIFFLIMRTITIKKSYVCSKGYNSLLVNYEDPPFIDVKNTTQFYTFVDPSYSLTFYGTFIEQQVGGFFNRDIILPKITLNDSRFSFNREFIGCATSGWFDHYKKCERLVISFELNTTEEMIIQPYPVTITIEDPKPTYSMYFSEFSNIGCSSNFTVLVIPLQKQNCYPSVTSPSIFCVNSTKENQLKSINFTMSYDESWELMNNYYPFIHQISLCSDNHYEDKQMLPSIINIVEFKNQVYVTSRHLNVTQLNYTGKNQKYIIESSHHGIIANVTFYSSIEYQAVIEIDRKLEFLAIPFVYKKNDNSFRSSYIAGGFYVNQLSFIDYEVLPSNTSLSLINVIAPFTFYLDKLPIITINDNPTSIYDYANPIILPFSQFFRYSQTLVSSTNITVQTRELIKSMKDVKSIKIEIPECVDCEYTQYYS
ncbi:hypothetical protein EHI8A_091330 [Entamoeba histolytica HM-1:IMSS-B]|uniref:Transmembrane protein n=6 Tax=Entamoeba histolytica TaxID=5759 RepID=B1N315_ENTH1|nr:hypothetical protein EHI_007910 [Entamoeba histolytica HM-1:IMSS]EMD48096.1 Hypothetical protein EHI5A_131860 [Entamoeba histolytica KU27]EMH75056.1 hypothetical protein EHI8A_091330 [Entamoeba histolytica HM-1:IMSS-B]EMS14843.1 hypothetical protein KM1_160170 [Entamoeba histolytica HM-3:IMSS]ENY65992.1 hypothetical protein EHI7A_089390 [Entamoeba histolytica HM-1:IMSS-A]GAT93820.1 hypothetical protein CL6EHI_007910 [Entamoeba histolytica]|eukprot:XP_001913581.1 hypothetical protein EHI_007910 [Entamoeba histolytica HM-1:IMSS]